MTDFEREDLELKAIMGDKFHDATREPVKAEPKKASKNTTAPKKTKLGIPDEAKDAIWSPFNAEPSFTHKLMDCAKWASLYSALCLLFFYWQQTGQMKPSAAVPAMLGCAVMVGFSFGKYAIRGKR